MLFAFKISLESPDANSAQTKITALTELAKRLSEKELKKLAEIVKEGGETYRIAKNFLNL